MKIVLLAMSVVGWFNFQLPTIQATKTTFLTAPIQVGQLRAKMVGQFETKRVDLFPAKRVDQLQRFLHAWVQRKMVRVDWRPIFQFYCNGLRQAKDG